MHMYCERNFFETAGWISEKKRIGLCLVHVVMHTQPNHHFDSTKIMGVMGLSVSKLGMCAVCELAHYDSFIFHTFLMP